MKLVDPISPKAKSVLTGIPDLLLSFKVLSFNENSVWITDIQGNSRFVNWMLY